MSTFGAREDDFRHFVDDVLRPAAPSALLISGDLVDAKTRTKRGQQSEAEWQVGCYQLVSRPVTASMLRASCRQCAHQLCVYFH